MSKFQGMLVLEPPEYGSMEEHFKMRHTCPCPRCNGNGWYWSEDEYGESIKKDCPNCDGSGRLRAIIDIEWESDV